LTRALGIAGVLGRATKTTSMPINAISARAAKAALPRCTAVVLPSVVRRVMCAFIVVLLIYIGSSCRYYTTMPLYSGGRLGYNKGAKNDPKNDPSPSVTG